MQVWIVIYIHCEKEGQSVVAEVAQVTAFLFLLAKVPFWTKQIMVIMIITSLLLLLL